MTCCYLQDLKLGTREIERLRGADHKKLLREKKLVLILDLDHTLLNSTRLADISSEEEYLLRQVDSMKGTMHPSLVPESCWNLFFLSLYISSYRR